MGQKKQQITNNIAIPNKNSEILKKHFSNCFDKNENFDLEKFKKEISKNEMDFSKESYGVDWLGKSYARLIASDNATTLLKENKDWNKKDENKDSKNLLIKGDNLEVLKHLSNNYYEQIKMIYIDPPYNTGSDGFVYQDDRKFTVEELSKLAGIDEEKAKRILEFTQSKSNSHSAWLTFMYPRLYIAKQLLKDDGVIFISIDDNEVAQLRVMMDEIFGEENFVGNIAWRKTDNQANIGNIARVKEYIILYAKLSKNLILNKMKLTERAKREYRYKDKKGYFRRSILLHKTRGQHHYEIKTPKGKVLKGPWMKNKKDFDELEKKDLIYWTSGGDEQPYGKIYLNDSKGQISNDFLGIEYGTNQQGSIEVENLFGARCFDFPKPVSLIKHFVTIGTNNSDIILDFFAGSGTTGDAVMQLNAKEAGENRRYFLVQLPEKIDPKKNKTAYDYVRNELKVEEPTIFDIAKERLIKAGKKIQDESKDKEKIKNLDFGFKIFETTPIWENYNFDAEEFSSQTKLFNESKLSKEDLQVLLTTWKTYDGIPLTQDLKEINLEGYTGYYFDSKLYLVDKGFKTKNLKKLLTEIDENKEFNPAIVIVFGYNFESKILREIAENIKNYANKKHIEVDFITRY